jgi:hypothetical protein
MRTLLYLSLSGLFLLDEFTVVEIGYNPCFIQKISLPAIEWYQEEREFQTKIANILGIRQSEVCDSYP